MKIFRILGVLFCTLFIASSVLAAGVITTQDAWTRASNTKTSASYMKIQNHNNKDIIFVSATSEAAAIVELHKTVTENNISQMVPINKLLIPAGGEVLLQPKGLHIMLMGLKKRLAAGDVVPIILNFENHKPVLVNTVVK